MGKHKEKSKKSKKSKKHERKATKSRKSSSSSADEWVEKRKDSSSEADGDTRDRRDEWMSMSTSFITESHTDRRKLKEVAKRLEKEKSKYNPRECTRELNPYWKDGGDGLPKFQKPSDDLNPAPSVSKTHNSNWRKKTQTTVKQETKPEKEETQALSDKELNILASKLVKAEIMGKTELVKELKEKLEAARNKRQTSPETEQIILTETDSQGHSRPVKLKPESSSNEKKRRKIETHQDGKRVRYFADDDKHSLQQMFENEKFNTVYDQNKEFLSMASKIRKNDDLEDIFTDNIRKKESAEKLEKKERDRAINEHQKVIKSVDYCKLCLQSESMPKHLLLSFGEVAFLSLPPFEPLTEGHCLIAPIRHVKSSTLLDENEWEEISNFRKALTRMFSAKNEDVIFFETAKNLDRHNHMFIECIPMDKEEGETAPIYFKKAIDECEVEWAQNKKLVSLKGRDVRKAIPKGLPYFFVSFGMEEGFAHVIENEKDFPSNFAQEIIGGILDLHHSKWRKPKLQSFDEQSRRVLEFSKKWNDFDCTKS